MTTVVALGVERTLWATRAFAVFLALHGVAHFVGTSSSFKSAADGTAVEYLGGGWVISDPAALRALGVAWAIVGAGFLMTAWAYWTHSPRRRALLVGLALASLVLSVAAIWQAVVGVVIDIALLVGVARTGSRRPARQRG